MRTAEAGTATPQAGRAQRRMRRSPWAEDTEDQPGAAELGRAGLWRGGRGQGRGVAWRGEGGGGLADNTGSARACA